MKSDIKIEDLKVHVANESLEDITDYLLTRHIKNKDVVLDLWWIIKKVIMSDYWAKWWELNPDFEEKVTKALKRDKK